MNGADGVDLGLLVLPRWLAQLIVWAAILLSGGGVITWYAQEKAASVQEMMQDYIDGLAARLTPPTVVQHPAAVPQ